MNSKLSSLLADYNIKKGKVQLLSSELVDLCSKVSSNDLLQVELAEESRLLQLSAQSAQQSVKSNIEDIVTKGLNSIYYDRNYKFTIEVFQERGVSVAEFHLESLVDGQWVPRDFKSEGGGLCDVVSVLLRICGIILRRPKQRHLLILDEPFKHVKVSRHERASQFLAKISKELDIQIIMVTHSVESTKYADELWQATLENNSCKITQIPIPKTGDLDAITA